MLDPFRRHLKVKAILLWYGVDNLETMIRLDATLQEPETVVKSHSTRKARSMWRCRQMMRILRVYLKQVKVRSMLHGGTSGPQEYVLRPRIARMTMYGVYFTLLIRVS